MHSEGSLSTCSGGNAAVARLIIAGGRDLDTLNIVQVFTAGDLLDIIFVFLFPLFCPPLDLGVIERIGAATLPVKIINQKIFLLFVLDDLYLVRL